MDASYASTIPTFPLFQGVTPQGARMLLATGEIRDYAPGELLLEEGDSPTCVLLVLGGEMQIFVEREGREVVLNHAGPGSLLGELGVLACLPRSSSVRASAPSTVLRWTARAFRELLLQDPFLSERMFRESLRALIGKEKALIDSLIHASPHKGD